MNILFLTISRITDINARHGYTDLLRKFRDEGHSVYLVSPFERRNNKPSALTFKDGVHILKFKSLNIQQTNFLEKGLATLLLASQFKRAIKKYLPAVQFDLVLYSTPPITLTTVIQSIKKQHKAKSYLLLRDIFPQNAVDLEIIKNKGILHNYFRRKEQKLYAVSDFIGCMSEANVDYILKHNPKVDPTIVEVCPNCVEVIDSRINAKEKKRIRDNFKIPSEVTTFIFGGNLGKPQGIDFMLEVIASNMKNHSAYFVLAGSGTEYGKIENWFNSHKPENAILFSSLPKQEYDNLVQACDVGLIFLDKRFTIPNYPSRLLSYMEYKMPIIAATDTVSDVGSDAEKNGYGYWAISGDLETTNQFINNLSENPELIKQMGEKGYAYLVENFTAENSYQIIMSHFTDN